MVDAVDVLPHLPCVYFSTPPGPIPEGLVGATIVRFGAFPVPDAVEGGGLVIDYRPAGSVKARRVVLAFTELGMWVEENPPPADPTPG